MKILKSKRFGAVLVALTVLSLILTACGSGEPEVDVDAQRTSFAQTANAQATMTAEALPTSTPTQEPMPTATPTPEITPTLSGTEAEGENGGEAPTEEETPAEPLPTSPTTGGTNVARWMANDPPDNTNFAPGEAFTVTWTLENAGTSTWSTTYYIQFASGAQMGVAEDEKINLPYPVPPNTNVQISVDFVASDEPGEKRSNWKLYDSAGNAFYDFYIIIDVVPAGETEEPEPTP